MGDIWWIYANQTFLKHKWIYFLLKVQKTKIRANSSPQSCGRWVHSARNIIYECLLSQPLSVLTSFKWSQWWCVKNLFHALWWRKNISFKKDTENNLLVGPKKVVLFPEIGRVKISLTRKVKWVSEYIFLIKKTKQNKTKQKNKKTKRETMISLANFL